MNYICESEIFFFQASSPCVGRRRRRWFTGSVWDAPFTKFVLKTKSSLWLATYPSKYIRILSEELSGLVFTMGIYDVCVCGLGTRMRQLRSSTATACVLPTVTPSLFPPGWSSATRDWRNTSGITWTSTSAPAVLRTSGSCTCWWFQLKFNTGMLCILTVYQFNHTFVITFSL